MQEDPITKAEREFYKIIKEVSLKSPRIQHVYLPAGGHEEMSSILADQ